MTEATSAAKHRAARRPVTPLSDLASSLSDHTQGIGRRTAAVAVSSGLLISAGAPMAFAAETGTQQATAKTANSFQAQSARSILNAQSIASVPDNASWSSGTPTTTAVQVSDVTKKPTPKPTQTTTPSTSSTSGASQSSSSSDTSQNGSTFNPSGNAVLAVAQQYIGVPYVYGGTTPAGFDCSGFTQYVYAQLGYSIPRTSEQQLYAGTQVPASEAQPGDLIITPGHVAIYAGGNMMIDSAKPGTTIQYRQMWQTNPTFVRIIN